MDGYVFISGGTLMELTEMSRPDSSEASALNNKNGNNWILTCYKEDLSLKLWNILNI